MASEERKCQNCRAQFVIEPEDFDFYKKINVPAPTFCPKCRLQRRLAFYNVFNLYKRPCDLCKKDSVSMYAPDAPYKVYCPACWWSDKWDAFDYGREYDFSKPFFEQFNELWHDVPLLGLSIDLQMAEKAPYNNHGSEAKNCYLCFHVAKTEDSAYGFFVLDDKSVFDCSLIGLSELCYDSINTFKSNRSIGSRNLVGSLNCAFLRDSYGCQNCFASANLRNAKYHIFNEPYTKEEYFETIKKWDLGSYATYQEIKKRALEYWKKFPARPEFKDFSTNSTGSYVFQSKNCKECYEVTGAEDSKYLHMTAEPVRNSYDITSWGNNVELCYESCVVGDGISNGKFCQESGYPIFDVTYSKLSAGGSHHFGCVSVKKGEYVIFNKRYSKEEFEALREKIILHMNERPYTDKAGNVHRYGEFFPVALSPFEYNQTMAQRFFPLTKEDALAKGYQWREPEIKRHDVTKNAEDLPDHIKDAPAEIVKEVIGCMKCGKGFRIIQMEFDFLKKMNLPLPRECPFCRIDRKVEIFLQNVQKINRICDKCGIEFDTPHSKEYSPTLFCKKCYLETVL